MKKTFLFILTFFTVQTIFGQILKDSLSGKYQCTGIVLVDSVKKDELFSRTKEWIALNYKSANDVIQLADKETSKIILKGNFSTSLFLKQGWLGHTLVLDFKDGKLRYLYTDFNYYSQGSGSMGFESSMMSKKKIIKTTEENIASSILNLKKYLATKSNW